MVRLGLCRRLLDAHFLSFAKKKNKYYIVLTIAKTIFQMLNAGVMDTVGLYRARTDHFMAVTPFGLVLLGFLDSC